MGGIRFSKQMRDVLAASMDSARQLHHDYVGTEHLLLGLAASTPEVVGGAAMREELREGVYELVGHPRRRSARSRSRALPYTALAKSALEFAMTRARLRRRSAVEPDDLLHGLVEEQAGLGAEVLRNAGFDAVLGRRAKLRDPDRVLQLITLDDSATTPYYEQLAQQIKALIAEGRLIPGDRLPSVRRLADQLEIAPGTVARVYGQLEREGVVETAGRHGTSVAFPVAGALGDPKARKDELVGLLRPVAVAAFHLGATSRELFEALLEAVKGVLDSPPGAEPHSM